MGAGGLGVGKIRLAASPVLDSLAVMRNASGWVMGCGLTPAAAPLAPIFCLASSRLPTPLQQRSKDDTSLCSYTPRGLPE